MKCISPVSIRRFNMFHVLESVAVPCGKCPVCQQNRIADWLFRIERDVENSPVSFFITLTYDDEDLPDDGLVSKKDVQDFFKRLRSNCEPQKIGKLPNCKYIPLRYFLCSEYGSLHDRPHYHAIIWNVAPLDRFVSYNELFETSWKHGFVYIGNVTPASIRYVLKYMFKDAELSAEKQQSLFYLMSKGIGKSFIENGNNKSNIHDRFVPYLAIDHGRKRIPRYYKEKVWSKGERRRISDKSRRDCDPFFIVDDTNFEEYQKYLIEEGQRKAAIVANHERRQRLAKLGIRNP